MSFVLGGHVAHLSLNCMWDSNPCLNNGTCVDHINGFNCTCLLGFAGNLCETGWKRLLWLSFLNISTSVTATRVWTVGHVSTKPTFLTALVHWDLLEICVRQVRNSCGSYATDNVRCGSFLLSVVIFLARAFPELQKCVLGFGYSLWLNV